MTPTTAKDVLSVPPRRRKSLETGPAFSCDMAVFNEPMSPQRLPRGSMTVNKKDKRQRCSSSLKTENSDEVPFSADVSPSQRTPGRSRQRPGKCAWRPFRRPAELSFITQLHDRYYCTSSFRARIPVCSLSNEFYANQK